MATSTSALAAALCALLAACARDAPQAARAVDAAEWLRLTCGVTLAAGAGTAAATVERGKPGQGWTTWVSGHAEIAAEARPTVEAALRANRALHLRGASATRHSYESYDDAAVHQECEYDKAAGVLFFRYIR